jgi:membrane-associated phospholipid phosphatase
MDLIMGIEVRFIQVLQEILGWSIPFMKVVSFLGDEEFYMLILPLLYWCVDAGIGLRVGIMLLVSNGLNDVLKTLLHSPRPYWVDPNIKGLHSASGFGKPSGHAQNGVSIWGLLAADYKKRWATIAAIVIIFLIGLSRMVLGVHFVRDVLLGWLVGLLLLLILLKFDRQIANWIGNLNLPGQILITVACSLVLVFIPPLVNSLVPTPEIPQTWYTNAHLSIPDYELPDTYWMDTPLTIGGTWLGLLTGYFLYQKHYGKFNTSGAFLLRLARYPIGAVGVAILWYGLGAIFPRNPDLLSYSLRYLRYSLIGFWISFLSPFIFVKLKLAGKSDLVDS